MMIYHKVPLVEKLLYHLLRSHLKLEHPIRRVRAEMDLSATMTDGTVLLADRWLPDSPGEAPLLLLRTPYGRRNFASLLYSKYLAHQGFQVLIQSCRGTGGSGGAFSEPFKAEISDGRDTVEWLRAQSFYQGKFATVGGSYCGYTQLALPPESKKDLVGAVLQTALTSTRELVWPNGCLALEAPLGWTALANRDPTAFLSNMFKARRDARAVKDAGMRAPLSDSYKFATGNRVPFFERWCADPAEGHPHWDDEDLSGSLDTYDCPVLIQAGWYDLFLDQSLGQYERIARRRNDARLTVGPWTHSSFIGTGGNVVMTEMIEFLWSAFGRPQSSKRPPIRLLESISKGERFFDSWPVKAKIDRFYFGHGSLGPAAVAEKLDGSTFTYNPHDPTPSLGGNRLSSEAGLVDNQTLEARDDVLVFDSAKANTATSLAGQPRLVLWVSSDSPAPQLFIRLNIVDSKGRSTNLTDKIIKATLTDQDGRPSRITIDLPPICVTVQPGQSLRVLVTGGAYPQYARSSGSTRPQAEETEYGSQQISVHHNEAFDSYLELPAAA